MSARLKRRIVIAVVAAGVVGLGGSALAASSSGGGSFLGDVAQRLGVSQSRLQSAIDGAVRDRLNQLVKEGRLTPAQANAIEKAMKQHGGAQFPGPFGLGDRGHFGGPMPGFRMGFGFGGPAIGGSFQAAAGYLGVSEQSLMRDLRSGKTLAAIAKAKGKSVSGLEQAMLASARARLDAAVRAGHLTKAQEAKLLRFLSAGIDRMVTGGFPAFGHHGFGDGPMWGHRDDDGAAPAASQLNL